MCKGSSLDIGYMQVSRLVDLTFVGHQSEPFVIRSSSASTFEDIWLRENAVSALLLETGDFRWIGGTVEDHGGGTGGLKITGPPRGRSNSYPGGGVIAFVRQESAPIEVHGVDDLQVLGGYHLATYVSCDDCGGRFFVLGGSWPGSYVSLNGARVHPEQCASV
jgi:hypothetical protein